MFYLTDGVKTIVMASIIVALFFPYNLSGFFAMESYAAYTVDIVFYLIKVLLVVIFSVTLVRVAIARLKIDQIVYTYWIPLTLIGLVGLICLMWDPTTTTNFNWPTMLELFGIS
jgi:NADH:ubiquinone oxidoreductase subunit H